LATLCDIVVMGENAYLFDPHVNFGLGAFPTVQLVWPRLTSYNVAKELLMSARKVTAAEAVQLGLANRVCPAGQEVSTAVEIGKQFVVLPREGIAKVKASFNAPLLDEFESRFTSSVATEKLRVQL
jgi:enoyl-CoA hydratase